MVDRIRAAVAVDGGKGHAALRSPETAALPAIWESEFTEGEAADWPAVQARLHEVLVAARVSRSTGQSGRSRSIMTKVGNMV